MPEKKTAAAVVEGNEIPERSILIELEHVAVNGRQIRYDVLKSVLADKGAKLTPLLFTKHCLNSRPELYLKDLLEELNKARVSAEGLAKDINEGIKMSLLDSNVKLNAGLKILVDAAPAMGISIGLNSSLDKDTANQLAETLGLLGEDTELLTQAPGRSGQNGPNSWQKLSRRMGRPAVRCMVIATSLDSCRAALEAGMRCAVVCDDYTSFQDFGGADIILDSLDSNGAKSILALVKDS